jgi:signal transduction histidine kinase
VLRALDHVLENAIRHAPDGSVVGLAVRDSAGEIAFAITDHGAGIADETLEHLYDRAWHGRRASRVGAGLGLAVVRGFMTAHGGRVEVATRPGETTFTLVVPRDTASVPDVSALIAARPAARP